MSGLQHGGGGDDVFSDMLQRLQRLSERLTGKEAECVELTARNRFLQSDAERARDEASAARDELQQEATKLALLEQRCARQQEEARQQLVAAQRLGADKQAMDSTLTLVQAELNQVPLAKALVSCMDAACGTNCMHVICHANIACLK